MQISEFLIREIAAGRLVDGERLPPERDLAKSHNTTVRTLRKALLDLENKGLLERAQGSGNYIRTGGKIDSVYSMFRLELTSGGGLPTAQFLDIVTCEKPETLPRFGTSNHATRFRRLRFLNKIPIALEEIWLDQGAGTIEVNTVGDSLYRTYQVQLGLRILRAEDRVSIGVVPDWSPAEFSQPSGATVGFVERFSWAQSSFNVAAPVEFSRTWFDTNKALYVQRLI